MTIRNSRSPAISDKDNKKHFASSTAKKPLYDIEKPLNGARGAIDPIDGWTHGRVLPELALARVGHEEEKGSEAGNRKRKGKERQGISSAR